VLDCNCGRNKDEENARFKAETANIIKVIGNNVHEYGPYLSKAQDHHQECLDKLPPAFKLNASANGINTGNVYDGGANNYNRGYSGNADEFAEAFPALSGIASYQGNWRIRLSAGKLDGQPLTGEVSGLNRVFSNVWGVVHKDASGQFYYSVTALQYLNSTQMIYGTEKNPLSNDGTRIIFNVPMTPGR